MGGNKAEGKRLQDKEFFKMHAAAFTSIDVLAAKVPPIEEHQLNLVAFVEGDEKDE